MLYKLTSITLTQAGSATPVMDFSINECDVNLITRVVAGVYSITFGTIFTAGKLKIPGMGNWGDLGVGVIPIADDTGIKGYYMIYCADVSTNFITMEVYNMAGSRVDISALIGGGNLFLPDIRIYP